LLPALALVSATAFADGRAPILGTNAHAHLRAALACLNMTERDLSFEKDHGKPRAALEGMKRLLARPLELPALGDQALRAVASGDPADAWRLAAGWLEADLVTPPEAPSASAPSFPAGLQEPLSAFLDAARETDALLRSAFADLSLEERRGMAAYYLAGAFDAESRADVREAMVEAGMSGEDVDLAVRLHRDLDPEPGATNFLDRVRRVGLGAVLGAGARLQRAVEDLRRSAAGVGEWPSAPRTFATDWGDIVIGSRGADGYTNRALLVVEPGGDDRYGGDAGAANGLAGPAVAAILDLGGDDRYAGDGLVGPGAALFGVCIVEDVAGDDAYGARHAGQGAALFGSAWVMDREGDDVWRANEHAQGAGAVGVGMLVDGSGSDLYSSAQMSQGFAGVFGVGLLVDARGNDRYLAGGRAPDYQRGRGRFLSLSQGFATGLRPFIGGGVGALADLEGNDAYEADIYGQGASYWYAAGLLVDASGDDAYRAFHYAQGAGIHASSGLLADLDGNDVYGGAVLCQGAAHDYGVGMLFERGGGDTYTADRDSQGHGMNNALAILADEEGDDAYFARDAGTSQGVGNDGGDREYGSLAVLMDLAGADLYSCPARDGARLPRPDYGVVYDVEE
jgi:hypothetical protein